MKGMDPGPGKGPSAGTDDLDDMADLNEAIRVAEEGVAAAAADHPDRAAYLSNLGAMLLSRSERTGALSDFDQAIDVTRQAVAAVSADRPDRAVYLSNLGVALVRRF